MSQNRKEVPLQTSFWASLSEDIWAVGIATVLIVGVLLWALLHEGLKFATPVYQWADTSDLFR